MKHFLFYLAIVFLFFACKNEEKKAEDNAATIEQKQGALKDSSNFTKIQWIDADSTNKDMGKVKKGQTIEITYHFKNVGDKPLVIASVLPGCGCTVADKPEEPIAPGEEGKIVGKFDSKNQTATVHQKSINVSANTKPSTEHPLLFKVDVVE